MMALPLVHHGLVKIVSLEAGRQGPGQSGNGITSCDISTKDWNSYRCVACAGWQGSGDMPDD